jgi:hypothetical protein
VRILGDDDPDTLKARNNLAFAYRTAGRIDEAVQLYERTLADRIRLIGEDHLDIEIPERTSACIPERRTST